MVRNYPAAGARDGNPLHQKPKFAKYNRFGGDFEEKRNDVPKRYYFGSNEKNTPRIEDIDEMVTPLMGNLEDFELLEHRYQGKRMSMVCSPAEIASPLSMS